MSRFLHIVGDDKFIDVAVAFFKDLGGNHRFICINERKKDSYDFIKSSCVECFSSRESIGIVIKGDYDAVCFHMLPAGRYPLVIAVPEGKKVIWLSWGADIYYGTKGFSPLVKVRLYQPITQKYLNQEVSFKKRVKRFLKQFLPVSKSQRIQNQMQARVISRVDMCSTVIRSEYDSLQRLPFFNAIYFPFNYVRARKPEVSRVRTDGTFILVNNSADLSGNHLDILSLLTKRKITNPRLIPISYGKDKGRLQSVIDHYIDENRDALLTDYLDINEYRDRIIFCRAAVFGHIRQQAVGNIILCLRAGMKVFLYKNSFVYQYFKQIGVTLFSIEDDLSQRSIDEPLAEILILNNIKIISDLFDYGNVMSRVRHSLEKNGLMGPDTSCYMSTKTAWHQ